MTQPDSKKILKQLADTSRTGNLLQSSIRLMEWDQEVNMPGGGLSFRTEQNQLLSTLLHKQMTSNKHRNNLAKLIDIESGRILADDLSPTSSADIRELLRDYNNSRKIPLSFIKKSTATTTHSLEAWKKARSDNSFKGFLPHLKKLINLAQKKAEYLGYQDHPYDALLDQFEPGMTTKKLDSMLKPLKEELIALVTKIKNSPRKINRQALDGHFPIPDQKDLSIKIAELLGLSKDHYQLAEAAHPFCLSLCSDDIRVTTHYHTDNFLKALYATIHETGHALYENGLPSAQHGMPHSQPASFAVHESQSRFYETFIGQSRPFIKHIYPLIQKTFSPSLDNITREEFYDSVNHSEPSLIRIFADEVTYNLHIILRYEIEKGFIDGSLNPKDLPDIWNTKMRDYLGIVPPDFASGCLQDIHWSLGFFGYFPSYTIGNLYAGALYKKMIQTFPNWEQRVASGEMGFLKDFQKEAIHQHGRVYNPIELIENATGEKFTQTPYIIYLQTKYLP